MTLDNDKRSQFVSLYATRGVAELARAQAFLLGEPNRMNEIDSDPLLFALHKRKRSGDGETGSKQNNSARSLPKHSLVRPDSTFVPPPAELVASVLGTRRDVESAVAIQVGDDHLIRTVPVVFQEVHRPFPFGIPCVLEPGDAAGSSPRGGRDVDIAVLIQVRGNGFKGIVELRPDDMFLPRAPRRAAPSFSYHTT